LLAHHAGNSDWTTGPVLMAESLSPRRQGKTDSVAVGVSPSQSSTRKHKQHSEKLTHTQGFYTQENIKKLCQNFLLSLIYVSHTQNSVHSGVPANFSTYLAKFRRLNSPYSNKYFNTFTKMLVLIIFEMGFF